MTHWDQDIHRVQEIQQLLEDRQRYFSGRLNTSYYKLDPDGNPLCFPKLSVINKGPDSNEPSLGHSVEANFGSTDTCSNNLPLATLKEEEEEDDHGETGAHSDSSNGNQADHSQNESSVASGKTVVTKKKVVRKTAKTLRKWVTKNLKQASASPPRRKSNASTIENINSRKSSILRFKSVSFDGDSTEMQSELEDEDLRCEFAPARVSKKLKAPNPIKLLRRKSWILKAEMVSRLNEDAHRLNFNNVMTGISKSSISHARDKLRKAEKSLRAVVKNEHKLSIRKKQAVPAVDFADTLNSKTCSKLKPTIDKPAASRLAVRQQEEALRSDFNLREAFALIKIDPDPILELRRTPVENDSKPASTAGRKISLVTEKDTRIKEHTSRKSLAIDDSKTTQSLKRLTKLSIQHLQRQQSFIPASVQPLHTQKGKDMERKVKIMTEKPQGDTELKGSFQISTRRKSSVANTGLGNVQSNIPRQSKDYGRKHASNLAVPRMAAARGERRGSTLEEHLHHTCALDRLAGTVV